MQFSGQTQIHFIPVKVIRLDRSAVYGIVSFVDIFYYTDQLDDDDRGNSSQSRTPGNMQQLLFLPVVSASCLSTYLFRNDSFQTEIIAFVAFSSAQSALLYTTMNGQRRIRINTLSLSCTTALSNLFRGADLDTQFTYLLKNGMDMYSMLFIISSFNCFLVVTCWDNIHMCMQPFWGPYVIASIVLVI